MLKELCLAAGGTAAALLLRSQYERNHFVVEETTIESEKIKKDRTLVFLSDLHNKEFGKHNQRLIAAIAGVKPDAILIGGDTMVTRPGDQTGLAVTEQLVRQLTALAPVYYGNGNHEQRLVWARETYGTRYQELRALLKDAGAVHLSDRSAMLGADIRIDGLNIDEKYYKKFRHPQLDTAYITRHLGGADQKRFQILLAHSPMFFHAYAGWGADLTLAGHFHGGTIRLPVLGGVMTPQYHFFLPWCAGEFKRGERRMIVSRGLGTHSINIRLNDKPQVIVVHLKPRPTF